jgi:hypothetical protein
VDLHTITTGQSMLLTRSIRVGPGSTEQMSKGFPNAAVFFD